MEKVKNILGGAAVALILLAGCGKGSVNDPVPPVVSTPSPGKTVLLVPAKDQPCLLGQNISGNQAKVAFNWQTAANTSTYELRIKNLLTGQATSSEVAGTSTELTLIINVPYAWSVVSKSNASTVTTESDTWKFYCSGPTIGNYAPFPPEHVKPTLNAIVYAPNGKTTLQWATIDPDNDQLIYDIYVSTNSTPVIVKSGATSGTFEVNVTSGATYYWKVICFDIKGNSSDSGISKFTVY